jgi:hypothetical protein
MAVVAAKATCGIALPARPISDKRKVKLTIALNYFVKETTMLRQLQMNTATQLDGTPKLRLITN